MFIEKGINLLLNKFVVFLQREVIRGSQINRTLLAILSMTKYKLIVVAQ